MRGEESVVLSHECSQEEEGQQKKSNIVHRNIVHRYFSAQFILDHTHTHTHKGYSIHHEHATYIHKKKKTLKNIY